MSLRLQTLPLLLTPLVAAGCWKGRDEARPLTIQRTSPPLDDRDRPVLLNDSITVYFSEPILPLSVTPDAVTMLDEQGHQVPGRLRLGENWVAFVPEIPLQPDLQDGSFRPGGRYRLMVAGYPRPHAVRARDGRWLSAARTFDVTVASLEQRPAGLPSVLRPPASDVPFMLRTSDVPLQLAADAPRLHLHFTQPVLPSSVRTDAFEIRVLKGALDELRPRSARVVSSALDPLPGCTVEIDLGALPQRVSGEQTRLWEGDLISVTVRPDAGLVDYAGNAPLPTDVLGWHVVWGHSVPLCEWPGREFAFSGADPLLPGFEVTGTALRPRVRVEAGNGSLGVFRPTRDTTLRRGAPFDRGDGVEVLSDGADFPFLCIHVPKGVRVTIDASAGPVCLLSCGGIHIEGEVVLQGAAAPLPAGRFGTQPVSELLTQAPVAMLAAGEVEVDGAIVAEHPAGPGESPLLLATATGMLLGGGLPFHTVLVVEHDRSGARRDVPIEGPRGQSLAYAATFTYGLARGADFEVAGLLPWRSLPLHRDRGRLRMIETEGVIDLAWQSTSPDALSGGPDLSPGHVSRWQPARDGELLELGPGGFVQLMMTVRVRAGDPLPRLRAVRVDEP